jgi:hypothetical protein
MTAKQIMSQKPTTKMIDKYSGAEFTVAEITVLLAPMVMSRDPDIDAFAERFELVK